MATISNGTWKTVGLLAAFLVLPTVQGCLSSTTGLPDSYIDNLLAEDLYDQQLCETAQLVILNAQPGDFRFNKLVAKGSAFATEQMDADGTTNTVTIASLSETVEVDGSNITVDVACKLINQDRANDVLNLRLPAPAGSCRQVNELTYELALSRLSEEQRVEYLERGTRLIFVDDYAASAGAEWLPSVVNDFWEVQDAGGATVIEVQAPSVQVPWPESDGDWYQGTNHCKLITLAAMQRWMTVGALQGDTEIFPRPRPVCDEPSSRTSAVGSCLLYFGPAGAQLCQDYSGSGWSVQSARDNCANWHLNEASYLDSGGKYTGSGGSYSSASCADRDAVSEVRGEPYNIAKSENLGTCVFRCKLEEEALWHQLSPMASDPDGDMMKRTCDLFLNIDW